MTNYRNRIPAIIYALFELAVGILLLRDPIGFTSVVIKLFGGITLAIGIIYLVSYIRQKRLYDENHYFVLSLSVLSIIIGAVCLLLTGVIQDLFAAVAFIYGIIFILTAVYKIKAYTELKKANMPVSVITIIAAAISVILGLVVIINPFGAVNAFWTFTGIALIAEAALDFITVVMNF